MPFCTKCGNQYQEGAAFCTKCGNKLDGSAAATNAVAQPTVAAPTAPAPDNNRFSNVTIRYRCGCGNVFDGDDSTSTCPKCGAPLTKEGYIQMYRMGAFGGMAIGMGIYIDDIPCGHIANKQSLRIAVPYGSHKVHVTHTTTRNCNDPVFTVSPEYPYAWCKAHFSKAGFKIIVDPASPDEMPTN